MLRRTRRGLIALTLAGTLALAGCAAGTGTAPTASAQDVGAACAAVRENVADAAERLTQLDVTDPQASARVMGDVAASLSDAAGEIDNPEIAGLLPQAPDGIHARRGRPRRDRVRGSDAARGAAVRDRRHPGIVRRLHEAVPVPVMLP